ncbi:MAG: acyl-CoA dehydrogenase family protein, partial [Chloroflexi bacterium]|nr:acyl-CoA dehydrogenase family protein [Chloroflexota bacterium]
MTVAGYTLTPEQIELRKFARDVAERHLVARADEVEKAGAFFPRDLIDLFRDLDLLGIDVPQEHGGQGLDVLTCALVMEEIARGWFSASSYPVAMGTGPILAAGTTEQKARYLPRIARGEVITAFALTEPDAGSDASGLRTVARRDGDAYVI